MIGSKANYLYRAPIATAFLEKKKRLVVLQFFTVGGFSRKGAFYEYNVILRVLLKKRGSIA